MNHYIPFLKAKRGEFNAMSELTSEVKKPSAPSSIFRVKRMIMIRRATPAKRVVSPAV